MEDTSPTSENQNSSFTIDLDQNAATLSINKEIYTRILLKALEQTKQDIQDFENALNSANFDVIQSLSHRFKGDYDNLRITALSSPAKEMNELSKTSKDKDRILNLFNEFKNTFNELQNYTDNLNK